MTGNRSRRAAAAAALGAVGLAAAAALAASGALVIAVAVAVVAGVTGIATYYWSATGGDTAAVLGGVGDERQRAMDLHATAVAGLAMAAYCVVRALVAIAHGGDNPWAVVCLVGALAYAASFATARFRS